MAHHWRVDAWRDHDGAAGDLLGAVLYWPLGLELVGMTQEDIIRMAVGAQLITIASKDGVYMKALERFAALVAAAEREACALIGDSMDPLQDGAIGRAIRARGQA